MAGEEKLSNGLVVIVEKLSILVSCFLCYQLEKPVFVSSWTWGRLEKRSFLQTHVIVNKLSIYFLCFVNSKVLVLVFRVVIG